MEDFFLDIGNPSELGRPPLPKGPELPDLEPEDEAMLHSSNYKNNDTTLSDRMKIERVQAGIRKDLSNAKTMDDLDKIQNKTKWFTGREKDAIIKRIEREREHLKAHERIRYIKARKKISSRIGGEYGQEEGVSKT